MTLCKVLINKYEYHIDRITNLRRLKLCLKRVREREMTSTGSAAALVEAELLFLYVSVMITALLTKIS